MSHIDIWRPFICALSFYATRWLRKEGWASWRNHGHSTHIELQPWGAAVSFNSKNVGVASWIKDVIHDGHTAETIPALRISFMPNDTLKEGDVGGAEIVEPFLHESPPVDLDLANKMGFWTI